MLLREKLLVGLVTVSMPIYLANMKTVRFGKELSITQDLVEQLQWMSCLLRSENQNAFMASDLLVQAAFLTTTSLFIKPTYGLLVFVSAHSLIVKFAVPRFTHSVQNVKQATFQTKRANALLKSKSQTQRLHVSATKATLQSSSPIAP